MPLNYFIDSPHQVVTITGELSNADEWRDLAKRLLADRRMRPGLAFIRDLREARATVDDAWIVEVFDVVRRFWPHFMPSKGALVTRRDQDTVAMVGQALADGEHLPIRVFDSYDAALEWIDRERTDRDDGKTETVLHQSPPR